MIRLAAVYSHPTQYTAPLFRELAARREVDFRAYFLSRQGLDVSFDPHFGKSFRWDIPLLDGYDSVFLPNVGGEAGVAGFWTLRNLSVIGELRRQRYDAVLVHGYEHLAKWFAFGAALSGRTPLILRGESTLISPRSAVKRVAKSLILGNLFRVFSAVTYIGEANRKYFESYGVPPEKLHFAPYSVDNGFFARESARLRPQRRELRAALGIMDDAPTVVSIAKLTSLKQPDLLLRAFAWVRARVKCHLLFVGDGNLRPQIEEAIERDRIPDVHLAGFINQSRIPEMHACADILALPSQQEPWGLAVNEAMASGLPAIVSDRVGCGADLIVGGVTGFTVRHDSGTELAQRLETLVADDALRRRMGESAAERVEGWSIARTADGILSAAEQCAGGN